MFWLQTTTGRRLDAAATVGFLSTWSRLYDFLINIFDNSTLPSDKRVSYYFTSVYHTSRTVPCIKNTFSFICYVYQHFFERGSPREEHIFRWEPRSSDFNVTVKRENSDRTSAAWQDIPRHFTAIKQSKGSYFNALVSMTLHQCVHILDNYIYSVAHVILDIFHSQPLFRTVNYR